MYSKRTGTSGIRGQLYETKLISLIHFRAIHDDSIEEFHLATNVDQMGAFDDICFKAKLKGFDRPLAVFIQAKHKDNETQTLKIDIVKYFESYLNIRNKFQPSNKDVLFEEKFDETECLFVIYTNARVDSGKDKDVIGSSLTSKLNDLVGTDRTAKQPAYIYEEDVEFLCAIVMKEEIISLAGRIAKFIYHDEDNYQSILNDELVLRYHVILAQSVFEVSEIKPEKHRIAFFRQQFFDTEEELVTLLKVTLYKEILKNRKLEHTDIKTLLTTFLEEPSDVKILSELIGTVIRYNNGQLEFVDKMLTESYKRQMNEVCVSQATVDQAVELAAKEILSSRRFKVPTAFGNKDITINGSEAKVERRLNYLASKFCDLLEKSKSNNNDIVTIDESLENGFLQLNGGIAGAVGNILILDENKKLMKFTENCEILGVLAKRLFEKLKSRIHNLHEHKFSLKVKKFPKLSWDHSEYEENLAKDFLHKLLIYSNQADETRVGEILKKEIEGNQCDDFNKFQIRTDAILLYYHDEIQKWWMEPKQASYLTKKRTMYESAINNIIKAPLTKLINMMYRMKHINYTFSEDALRSLNLQDQHSRTTIITESSALTAAKVIQCLKEKDHFVLDLKYILNLPKNDRNAISSVLTNEEKTQIFVCDMSQSFEYGHKSLEYIAKAVHDKTVIIITNQISYDILRKYFAHSDNEVYDTKINLIDLSEESQKNILKTTRVIFQGQEVSLDMIIDDESLACVEGEVLNKIINKETIVVGKAMGNSKYDEIKHLYVDRRIKKPENGDDDHIVVKSLHDIVDDVVFVTGTPGTGKSTFVTHLSLKTKELDPKVWIVRINSLEYSREFSMWKKDRTAIDLLETLNFMCRVILREKLGKENKVKLVLEEANSDVHLTYCTGDQETVFELKLFLHFYNREKLIILFDGFDEICPHYTNEVTQFLKTVSSSPRKHRMWVTSRSYNEVKSVLEREFGRSYEIAPFSDREAKTYLEKFWKSNLILEELDDKQLKNFCDFNEFMYSYRRANSIEKSNCQVLLETYHYAYYYFRNEIKSTNHYLWTDNNYRIWNNHTVDYDRYFYRHREDTTPLVMYLAADYFQSEIKDVDKISKWDLDSDIFTSYEGFIEKKLKIQLQDKDELDIYKPNLARYFEKELADILVKHKKLGAYAIFNQHKDYLFSAKELKEIKDTIKLIEKGKENTGLIQSVADDIPIFIHMTFTEYFAAEYVCDLLKNENCNEKQKSWLDFTFNIIFATPLNVLNFFDSKIKSDKALMSVLENNRELLFKFLMEQGKAWSEYFVNSFNVARTEYLKEVQIINNINYWSLRMGDIFMLDNFLSLLMGILESSVNLINLNDFLEIVCGTLVLPTAFTKCNAFVIFVLNIVRKIDKSKLKSVLLDNFCYLPRDTNYDAMTTEEIVEFITVRVKLERDNFQKASPINSKVLRDPYLWRKSLRRFSYTRPFLEEL